MMDFNFQDAWPSLPLGDIYPLSVRAESWLARASRQGGFSDKSPAQIAGAVSMLCGLDYHHGQFMTRFEKLTPYYARRNAFLEHVQNNHRPGGIALPIPTEPEKAHIDALHHEAVAYLNRVGQFVYFADAMHLKARLPRATELLSFRNKHTSYGQIWCMAGLTHRGVQAANFC